MFLARVVGEVVATIKHAHLRGDKLLLVRREQADGSPVGSPMIAVDTVDAGPGDRVLVADEGNAAAQVLRRARGPVRTVIVGVVDDVQGPDAPPTRPRPGGGA
jgi:ethanolamine utilization protein EutN